MMAELIDRRGLKLEMKTLLADAQVSPKAMTALYMGILLVLNMTNALSGDIGILTTFISILTSLLGFVLHTGFVLYCMAIRRGERAEFLTLFDGFSFVGKIIALNIVMSAFIWLWSLLFVIPGIVAAYRYRFALYNLYENPGISVMEALDMSKRQTLGYKSQLFLLDVSYFGWNLLATIPSVLYSAALSQEMAASMMASTGFLSAQPLFSLTSLLPLWGWTLTMGLWQLMIALFYLPNFQCVDLCYFEIAKNTSGTGSGIYSHSQTGPDGMGGF